LQNRATSWLWTYNNERPNMGIGGITPIQKRRLTKSMNSTPELH
jgi:putative transposase